MENKANNVMRILGVLYFSLSLVLSANGAAAKDDNQLKFKMPKNVNPELWVIKDSDTTIHILGTIHYLPENIVWLKEPILSAFLKSGELVLETLPSKDRYRSPPESRSSQAQMAKISETISSDKLAEFEEPLSRIGVSVNVVKSLPLPLAQQLISLRILDYYGLSSKWGVETVLSSIAQASGKTTVGLSTSEEQAGYVSRLPRNAQVELFYRDLQNITRYHSEYQKLLNAWAAGDNFALGYQFADHLSGIQNASEALTTKRHILWADWIEDRMNRPGNVFIAVGSAHLSGDDGLNAHLIRKGIAVKRER